MFTAGEQRRRVGESNPRTFIGGSSINAVARSRIGVSVYLLRREFHPGLINTRIIRSQHSGTPCETNWDIGDTAHKRQRAALRNPIVVFRVSADFTAERLTQPQRDRRRQAVTQVQTPHPASSTKTIPNAYAQRLEQQKKRKKEKTQLNDRARIVQP